MSEYKILILAINEEHHPLEILGEMTKDWLTDEGFKDITITNNRASIDDDLDKYDMLILCMSPRKLSSSEEETLVSFVEGGKKLMAIHSASVITDKNREYVEMMGARFSHHPPYREFTVIVRNPSHPIVEGLEDFNVEDELYVLDRNPPTDIVLLTAFWEDREQPILYVRTHGQGKVLYNALGHGLTTYKNPSFRKTIIQGVKWLLN